MDNSVDNSGGKTCFQDEMQVDLWKTWKTTVNNPNVH